jgi:small-conductance mechanosensitive channel
MSMNLSEALQALGTKFILLIPKIIVAAVVMVLAVVFARLINRFLRQAFERRAIEPELILLFTQISRWLIIVLGAIVALQQVDFNMTTFLTSLGILGFTVGFALQDVSKHFVAGILLLFQRPFYIGEIIEVAGYKGKVLMITMRATELDLLNGNTVLIPNATVFTNAIVKITETKSGIA